MKSTFNYIVIQNFLECQKVCICMYDWSVNAFFITVYGKKINFRPAAIALILKS